MNVYLETLGCVRNQVDSEHMLGKLSKAGHVIIKDPAHADIIVINTCSFIEDAINESVDTILDLAKYKQEGVCQRMVVAGCLPERFRESLADTLPEVDVFLGTGAYDQIADAINGSVKTYLPDPDQIPTLQNGFRICTVPYLAYLKIAEGCSRHCTYCIIPKLRGSQKSRPIEDIVAEAQTLVASGARELILVAQDTTNYGKEKLKGNRISGAEGLSHLLSQLSFITDHIWIRFLYGHPESIDETMIRTIAEHPNICPYFDIPIQHASNHILQLMGRHYTKTRLIELFEQIRLLVPNAALRTTVMVGFPGETRKDFEELLEFIGTIQFDHLGVFIYSDAEDLPSHQLSDPVSKQTARNRHDRIMSRQMDISSKRLKRYIGEVLDVLVEEKLERNLYEGRTIFQAPEVDGITYIYADSLPVGNFAKVRIVDALEYDLVGEVV